MKAFLKRHKKLCIFLVIIGIIAVLITTFVKRLADAGEAMLAAMTKQETARIERRDLVESVSATGTVVSVGSKSVAANVSGVKVENVNIAVGDFLAAGDIICELDSSDLEEDMAAAQASLNSAVEKTQIEVTAAERSLIDAESTRDIELERANQDVADAWNDYLMALTDLEEAEEDYLEAQQATVEKNGEYEYRKELLEEADDDLEDAAEGAGQSGQYETQFATEKGNLTDYIANNGITCDSGALDKIYISSPDLPGMTWNSLVSKLSDASKQTMLDGFLGTLKGLQTKYQESTKADSEYQSAQSEQQSVQSEVTEWQTKYNTAKQNESSYKTAYENAMDAADAKLEAYNQKVRSQEDAVRNNDSTIEEKEDSVNTSQLNATVSGSSDKKQIREYQKQIEECKVTAPISGVVTEVNVEPGDNYTGAVIATIEDTSGYEVTAEIDEYDIGNIQVGQKVVIKTNGTGEQEFGGTVAEIAPRATQGAAEVTYTVTVSVDAPTDRLKMDMTAKLSIILESKENILTVPYEAVQEDENGDYYMEVVKEQPSAGEQDGEAEKKQKPQEAAAALQTEKMSVRKGIESDYYVEVTGSGLKEGMEVLVPSSADDILDIQNMMIQTGPMGGF